MSDNYRAPLGFAFLALMIFMAVGLWYTDGHITPPLDDTAIHLQYARQMADGEYYRYHDGDPRTSGATSWLYAHLLALLSFFGINGSPLAGAALILGAALFCWIILLAARLVPKGSVTDRRRTAFLLVFHGGLLWSFLSGMEIALFSVLLCASLLAYRNESHTSRAASGYRITAVLLVLLALVRPEGGFVAILIAGAVAVRLWDEGGNKRRIAARLAPAAGAVMWPTLWTWISTGRTASNGLLAKSLLYEPAMTWQEKVGAFAENLRGVFWWLWGTPELGAWPGEYLPPGGLVLALLGLAVLIRNGQRRGWRNWLDTGPVMAASIAVIALSVATLSVWNLHNYRYLLPILPLLLVLIGIGLGEIARWGRQGGVIAQILFVLILALQLGALPLWLSRYGRNCGSIHAKQYGLARWIAQNTEPETYVGVNDAGVLALCSNRRTFDLVGLMNNETAIPYRLGEGALYEYLSSLPPEERFRYFAVFPEWFRLFETFDILGSPIVRFPDPFDPVHEKVLCRALWRTPGIDTHPRTSAATRPIRPLPPVHGGSRRGVNEAEYWEVVDRLDVADLDSERAHHYEPVTGRRFPPEPVPFRRNFGYHEEIEQLFPDEKDRQLIPRLQREGQLEQFDILDAGRRHWNGERFTVSGLEPGTDLAVVLRTCQDEPEQEIFTFQMVITVGGRNVGTWTISGTPWNWYERWLIIPGDFIKQPEMEFQVSAVPSEMDRYYCSYYYWFLQPG